MSADKAAAEIFCFDHEKNTRKSTPTTAETDKPFVPPRQPDSAYAVLSALEGLAKNQRDLAADILQWNESMSQAFSSLSKNADEARKAIGDSRNYWRGVTEKKLANQARYKSVLESGDLNEIVQLRDQLADRLRRT